MEDEVMNGSTEIADKEFFFKDNIPRIARRRN